MQVSVLGDGHPSRHVPLGGFTGTETPPTPRSPALQAQGLVIALHVCKMCRCAQEGSGGEEEGVAGKADAQWSQSCLCLRASELLLRLASSWETLTQGDVANGFVNCSASRCPARREPLSSSQAQPS